MRSPSLGWQWIKDLKREAGMNMNRNLILSGQMIRIPMGLEYSWYLLWALMTCPLALFKRIPGFLLDGVRICRARTSDLSRPVVNTFPN